MRACIAGATLITALYTVEALDAGRGVATACYWGARMETGSMALLRYQEMHTAVANYSGGSHD